MKNPAIKRGWAAPKEIAGARAADIAVKLAPQIARANAYLDSNEALYSARFAKARNTLQEPVGVLAGPVSNR